MDSENKLISISVKENIEKTELDLVSELVEKLDFIDILILRKFYATGKEFPNDTQPYCFPLLYREMKLSHKLKIGMEALRKRLNNLTRLGFLVKIKHSNPTNYSPVRGKEKLVREVILKFFVVHGIAKFL